jgi:hypothetical protein
VNKEVLVYAAIAIVLPAVALWTNIGPPLPNPSAAPPPPITATPAAAAPSPLPPAPTPTPTPVVPPPPARGRATPAPPRPLARLEPAAGAYIGVSLDWGWDTATAFNRRLGARAAVYVQFVHFPMAPADEAAVDGFIDQVVAEGGMALLTLEPRAGLGAVTPANAAALADRLAGYNRRGAPVFLRFAHEMNGSWYPWSQQPAAFVDAFRLIAAAVHQRAPRTAMLWAPNYGAGYAFRGGRYQARPGTADFVALDTNADGRLDMNDDMYAPYYPGDDAVDWVGMSVYHWGNTHPWGENELPEADKFIAHLTGTYVGLNGDERGVPDFYRVYVEGHGKPMSVTETAAFFRPGLGGDERRIKQAWQQQVFSDRVARDFPGVKMINWFEWRKFETEVGDVVDWTVSRDPVVARDFMFELTNPHWRFGPALAAERG